MRTPLQPNEEVLLRTQTTWVVLVVPALVALIAIAFGIWLAQVKWAAIVIIPAVAYFGYKYLEWQHNIWVVTNFRVIDEFGIFTINSKESPLDKINNVSYSQPILGRLLNFGNVEIQTAATIGETIYENVHGPKTLKDTITLAQSHYGHNRMSLQVKEIVHHMQNTPPVQPTYQSSTYVVPPPVLTPAETKSQQYISTPANHHSLAAEIEKLYELKQKGILTEEEYLRAKNKLLG